MDEISPVSDPIVKAPGECTPGELEAFLQMALRSGEVGPNGLAGRIADARVLAFTYAGTTLAAIGAVKNPDRNYLATQFKKANADESAADYPVELGWVHVDKKYQGQKLSRKVVDALLPFFGTINCYATSKVSRDRMHATLRRFGFIQSGTAFPSRLANENLLLFLRTGQPDGDR